MSFDVNVGRNEPIIKAASNMNNDGGSGGNLGYMRQGKRGKGDGNRESLFSKNDETDKFESSYMTSGLEIEEMINDGNSWLKGFLGKLKK